MTWMLFFQAVILAAVAYLIYTTERHLMALQDVVDTLTEELARAYGEIKAEIAELKAQVEAAGVAEQVDFTALQTAAEALDNIVPDIATEPEGDVEIAKRDDTDDK